MNTKALDHTGSKFIANLHPGMVFSPVVFLHPTLCNPFFSLNLTVVLVFVCFGSAVFL